MDRFEKLKRIYDQEKEKELEDNFIKFTQGYFPDMLTEEIRPYLRWWKLKNKWKRELTKDDAKAVRMILRKIYKDKANES